MIEWSEEFETGSYTLDQQHRVLIENINALGEQLRTTNPTREEVAFVVNLVDYLGDYADVHFQGEEHCMLKNKCPAYAENQKGHERFRVFIHDFQRQCDVKGFKLELLRNLHELMESWIREHILKIDTQLRPILKTTQPSGSGALGES